MSATKVVAFDKNSSHLLGVGIELAREGVVRSAFGVSLSHMSVWRDMQEQARLLEKRCRWQGARVMGVDGLYPLGWGEIQAVLVAVEPGDGQGERSPLELLRNLLIRLSEHWATYHLFDWQKDVPWTNNGTEQVIDKMKNLS